MTGYKPETDKDDRCELSQSLSDIPSYQIRAMVRAVLRDLDKAEAFIQELDKEVVEEEYPPEDEVEPFI